MLALVAVLDVRILYLLGMTMKLRGRRFEANYFNQWAAFFGNL